METKTWNHTLQMSCKHVMSRTRRCVWSRTPLIDAIRVSPQKLGLPSINETVEGATESAKHSKAVRFDQKSICCPPDLKTADAVCRSDISIAKKSVWRAKRQRLWRIWKAENCKRDLQRKVG